MIVEAGLQLIKVQEAADGVDRLFPLSLASEGSCTLGGNLATNAGGTQVITYGNARDLVTGLEVVLADGRDHIIVATTRRGSRGAKICVSTAGSSERRRQSSNGSLCTQPSPLAALMLAPPMPMAATSSIS
jgi:hypothetical protein